MSLSSIAHRQVAVDAGGAELAPADPGRTYLLVINDGEAPLYLALGAAAAAGQGIRINAAGGAFEMTAGAGNLYLGLVTAVAAAATVALVTEASGGAPCH